MRIKCLALTIQNILVILHTPGFSVQKYYIVNTLCVYAFYMNLRPNSSCFTLHH